MGGAIGSLGAALVQEEYPEKEIKIINWNSYSTFAKAAKQLVTHHLNCCFLFDALIGHLAYWLLRGIGGNIDATAALSKIKQKVVIWNLADGIIPPSAQAISQLKTQSQGTRGKVISFSQKPHSNNGLEEHNRTFTAKELLIFHDVVKQVLHLNGQVGPSTWPPEFIEVI